MKSLILAIISASMFFALPINAQQEADDVLYRQAYTEIADMLDGKKPLSVKRAVFLAEWAYLDGKLDYENDFCKEIDRIADYIKKIIAINHFEKYKTAKQFSLCNYFFQPCNGNNKLPYTYDFDKEYPEGDWNYQITSRTLKTHKGQCRSLPWTLELGADVHIAYSPRHCFLMYKDEDDHYPEDWVNVELTNHTYVPTFSIKDFYCISDSAVLVGTYITPLDDGQTIARQLADLAMGYLAKYNDSYGSFTLTCAEKSLQYFEPNPNGIIIMGKSLEAIIRANLTRNGGRSDRETEELIRRSIRCKQMLDATHWTPETEELRSKWTNNGKPAPPKQIITREMYEQMNQK